MFEKELTFNNAPGVQASSHSLPFGLNHCVAAYYSKGNTFLGKKFKTLWNEKYTICNKDYSVYFAVVY